jgi:hypothetical protein
MEQPAQFPPLDFPDCSTFQLMLLLAARWAISWDAKFFAPTAGRD